MKEVNCVLIGVSDMEKDSVTGSADKTPLDTDLKISERVKAENFTADTSFCKKENAKADFNNDRRSFWLKQWQDMHQNSRVHNSLNNKDRRDIWQEIIESGKSPIETFESYIDDMDKDVDSDKHKHCIFKNEEMRRKWEAARAEGKSEEFWYEYWDDKQKEHPFLTKAFGHPREIQNQWKELKSEGKEPEEIWQTIVNDRWSWNRRHHVYNHSTCRYYQKRREHFCGKKEHDNSYIYQQFDF